MESNSLATHKSPVYLLFGISAVFHYLGPAFAVLLFSQVEVLGVAWIRVASAGVIFALWRRPWRAWATMTRRQRRTVLAFGSSLAVMNIFFYLAISRVPLATVGAIEFLSPIALAAYGTRNLRNSGALIMAVAGAYLLADVRIEGEPLGFVFAFINCGFFLLYIVFGHRAAQDGGTTGVDRLSVAMLVALVVITPVGLMDALPAFSTPVLFAAGVGVGICSSVIPYVTDQIVMARVPRATFALLLSLLPVFGTIIGMLVLRQVPTGNEVIGIILVMCGISLHKQL